MTFTPACAGLPGLTTNSIHLAATAQFAVSGNTFYAPFDTYFVTSNNNNIVTSPVTAQASPSNGGTVSGGGTYNCRANATVCAYPNACSSFVSWTVNGSVVSTAPCYTFTVSGNQTLVANFAVVSYSVDASTTPVGGGSTSGDGGYSCGANATVCATASSCYSFANWTVNGNVVSASPCYTFVVTGNQSLVANFTLVNYSISTSTSGGGSTSGDGEYACGANVTVCATPASCYNFSNWTINSNVVSASACFSFGASGSKTLMANFAPSTNYVIGASCSPAAGGTVTGGGTVACESNVTLCAAPSPRYTFINWTDQSRNVVSTSFCYSFPATNEDTLEANFIEFQITGISLQGSDVLVTWVAPIGSTNTLQTSEGDSFGSCNTNGFVDVFGITNATNDATNYLDIGAETNAPIRYYRVRLVQ